MQYYEVDFLNFEDYMDFIGDRVQNGNPEYQLEMFEYFEQWRKARDGKMRRAALVKQKAAQRRYRKMDDEINGQKEDLKVRNDRYSFNAEST